MDLKAKTKKIRIYNETLVITDPCYLILLPDGTEIKEVKGKKCEDPWNTCDCGSRLDRFGVNNFITVRTLYGDWGCTVYNRDTKEKIGEFCADSGLVTVTTLECVLEFNPEFLLWYEKHKHCATIINNFTGTVEVIYGFRNCEEGKTYTMDDMNDLECWIEGEGEESLSFISYQTGI